MDRWLPYGVVSLIWVSLIFRTISRRQYRLALWWLGCWGLASLTWTPVALNFGGTVGEITTHWWFGGIWVIHPLQAASMDASFWLNILMTVPQGVLWQLNHHQSRWRQWLVVGLATGLTLEVGQALGNWAVSLGRWVDINDVITNCLGVMIGAASWRFVQRYRQQN